MNLIAIGLTAALLQQQSDWPTGREREVDEGTYMSVVANDQGWRVWKIETREGVACKAVKSAEGRPHPVPLGFRDTLWRGTPFLEVSHGPRSGFSYHWTTEHSGDVEVKFREPGARFWDQSGAYDFDAQRVGEAVIEVVITSWEYPALTLGRAEERARFNLAGLAWAQEQVAECEGVEQTPPGERKLEPIVAPPVMTSPIWGTRPRPAFPEAARAQGVTRGRVELSCIALINGVVGDCEVLSENPAGVGFGEAAVDAVENARLSQRSIEDAPGAKVRFPVSFRDGMPD